MPSNPLSANPNELHQQISELRAHSRQNCQDRWFFNTQPTSLPQIPWDTFTRSAWQRGEQNEKGYLVWEKGSQERWFAQRFEVPESWQGYPLKGLDLKLRLTWWAAIAEIHVNGELRRTGDLFDSSTRLLIAQNVQPGTCFDIALRVVSPGHDIGGLMRAEFIFESETRLDPGFVADELAVLLKLQPKAASDITQGLKKLKQATLENATDFEAGLSCLRSQLQPWSKDLKKYRFNLLGHAHLDMAWLWPVRETWDVAERTFRSVLTLQQEFADLTFGHTTPALYAWMETHRPELFTQIKAAVNAGTWELLGGMWVEPEVNLPSGESLIRQFLYGQRYLAQAFGKMTRVAWLPDSFGFPAQLPQIFKLCGIDYFVTGKLHWNDATKFPHGLFWWRAPDGTEIPTAMAPPNITGVMDIDPLVMADYVANWSKQTGCTEALWLPGVGDHGGGPTREMLTMKQRWQRSPFFPEMRFLRAESFFDQAVRNVVSPETSANLPTWNDELYLELHRGHFTAHVDQKAANRAAELGLYRAGVWASLASMQAQAWGTDYQYPRQALAEAWRQVLFNQFHDILPGTSIPEVFQDANRDWHAAIATIEKVETQALQSIVQHIERPLQLAENAQALVVFNPNSWTQSTVVELEKFGPGKILNCDGTAVPVQRSQDSLLFWADSLPEMGYALFWWVPGAPPVQPTPHSEYVLENSFIKAEINPQTGNIRQIWLKDLNIELLKDESNQFQFFKDQGQYWDAWDIAPDFADNPLLPDTLISIQWEEWGPVRSRIRIVRRWETSEFAQDYILEAYSPVLKIETTAQWNAEQTLLKTSFNFNFEAEHVTYHVPAGIIERTTRPQTPSEQAKWEIPALQWADFSHPSGAYGVSLLNHTKHGHDHSPAQLRLSLLRAPNWPDPTCDRGTHFFRYALYPHVGDWRTADTFNYATDFNQTLKWLALNDEPLKKPTLPTQASLMQIPTQNFRIMALKQAEDCPQAWILRGHESHGAPCSSLTASVYWGQLSTQPVDGLERPLKQFPSLGPWSIQSQRLTLADPPS
ncbi:MAG: alpha-mannosidase [Cyanobacteria bacterium P01_H01_bin.15]